MNIFFNTLTQASPDANIPGVTNMTPAPHLTSFPTSQAQIADLGALVLRIACKALRKGVFGIIPAPQHIGLDAAFVTSITVANACDYLWASSTQYASQDKHLALINWAMKKHHNALLEEAGLPVPASKARKGGWKAKRTQSRSIPQDAVQAPSAPTVAPASVVPNVIVAGGATTFSVSMAQASAKTVTPTASQPTDEPLPTALRELVKLIPQGSEKPTQPAFQAPDSMKILAICAAKDRTALMVGPSGTGKTSGIEWLAQKTGNKHLIVNLDGQSTVSSLIGGLKARNGSTVWEDGPVLYAMRHGIWLILDEIDFCDPSVLARLHGILQHGERHLFLAEANGETVVAHSGFRIFATANSLGLFDDDSLASGTNAMNFAFLRRWTVIQCGYPTVSQEAKRLACHGHADTVCSAIAKASDTVRKLIESRTLRGYWGTAHSMDFASWAMDLDSWEEGFIVSATGKFSPAEVRIAWEAIQRDCPAGSPRNPAATASATV